LAKFILKNSQEKPEKRKEFSNPGKSAKVSRIPSLFLSRPSKKVLKKSKFFQKKGKKPVKTTTLRKDNHIHKYSYLTSKKFSKSRKYTRLLMNQGKIKLCQSST